MTSVIRTPADLERLRAAAPDLVLLDVRLADDHAACRLPGAVNDCVFEVVFTDRLAGLGLVPDTPICVYGHDVESAEADDAVAKLERAGYRQIHVLAGGLAYWRRQGGPVEGTGAVPAVPAWPEGRRALDLVRSRVGWIGRNVAGGHHGTVPVTGGFVACSADGLDGGELTVDLRRITADDLAGTELHAVLVAHLQSDDFFDVASWPKARYRVIRGRFLEEAPPGVPNLEVEGVLELRGVEAPLDAVLAAGTAADGTVAAQGLVSLDRTAWGANYGSGRLYRRLAGHLVNDLIDLDLRLVLAPADS